jgi:hypothetical protein
MLSCEIEFYAFCYINSVHVTSSNGTNTSPPFLKISYFIAMETGVYTVLVTGAKNTNISEGPKYSSPSVRLNCKYCVSEQNAEENICT